ncbi:hypothetical protein EV207_12547 [Scopulibacillus darangshiensis]|uniref:Uncharacterized protein n=1 Tax=Scopulibacillus darangshiensis TaxID=442528 RepID=A0A4R2NRP2_9BACL|nr:hypothetical protein [Scopulibacillus darangshiensis]TCP24487.1 hypothetical protein EV207_12547 [Scopulibacillus darangshiensis]
MKKATKIINDRFPFVEEKLATNENLFLATEALDSLNDIEKVFLRLAWFFENPNTESFDLNTLYKSLNDDWLELALECVVLFFKEDTVLIQKPNFSVLREDDDYLNQNQFANYLSDQGLPYNRSKLNVYLNRGLIPEPDLKVANKSYWRLSAVKAFCDKEQLK